MVLLECILLQWLRLCVSMYTLHEDAIQLGIVCLVLFSFVVS